MRREVSIMVLPEEEHSSIKLRLRVGIHSGNLIMISSVRSTVTWKLIISAYFVGPCVAAIIGTKLPKYCLYRRIDTIESCLAFTTSLSDDWFLNFDRFGDTVNTASRIESHGEAGKIHCSNTTKELLDVVGGVVLIERPQVEIKVNKFTEKEAVR